MYHKLECSAVLCEEIYATAFHSLAEHGAVWYNMSRVQYCTKQAAGYTHLWLSDIGNFNILVSCSVGLTDSQSEPSSWFQILSRFSLDNMQCWSLLSLPLTLQSFLLCLQDFAVFLRELEIQEILFWISYYFFPSGATLHIIFTSIHRMFLCQLICVLYKGTTAGFLVCSRNVKNALPDVGNNVMDNTSDHITRAFSVVWCPGFMVVT
jgi:hypothetical protein